MFGLLVLGYVDHVARSGYGIERLVAVGVLADSDVVHVAMNVDSVAIGQRSSDVVHVAVLLDADCIAAALDISGELIARAGFTDGDIVA